MSCVRFWPAAALVMCAAAAPSSLIAADETSSRPNIVVIVGDDLGYGELGCYGGKQIPTPHLDALAASGVRFTDGYVSCPVCSPTRAGLLTGRYQQRFGHEFNPGPPGQAADNFGLSLDEKTIAERLKAAGYATGMVGKWHLGYEPQFHPLSRGFDEFYGFLGGAHAYLPGNETRPNPIQRGRETVDDPEYLTDALTAEAVAFIERHKSQPFFLYLTYNAVHAPLETIDKYQSRFANIEENKRQTFAAMLSSLDDGVGGVTAALGKAGLDENTLVFFVSDNGGPTPSTTSENGPLKNFKGSVYEGGIRVPFLASWKGHIPAGETYAQPVIALDILPTALAAAGVAASAEDRLDGVNLLPYIEGDNAAAPHKNLYWRFGEQSAIRQGNWKLLKNREGQVELYDLAADVGEQKNLAAEQPDKVKELQAAWDSWKGELAEPKWQGRARARRPGAAGGGEQRRLRRQQNRAQEAPDEDAS